MKTLWIICLHLIVLTTACAQDKAPNTTKENLNKHDLSWIKTASDFNQTNLSLEQIDIKLQDLILKSISKNNLISELELPINSKKLKYLGRKFPNETELFGTYNGWNTDGLNHLTWKAHFYTYGDFIITTKNDKALDQKNVYYAIRSIIILQNIYPELYSKIFSDTKHYITKTPQFVPLVNSNKMFWIAFNDNPKYISSNNTIYMYNGVIKGSNPTINVWNNIAVINIHEQNILGQNSLGSKPIYNASNIWKNYNLHMLEGLPVSIAHEMLHNYIDYAYSARADIFAIRKSRGKTNFIFAEENAVINTLYTYFNAKGGLLPNQPNYYYNAVFYPNLEVLKHQNQLKTYSKIFSDIDCKPEYYKTIFLLPVLEN
ncbi:hypothetical protein FNB79_11730 [Formosa sediminum]|uniref:DUF4932 domain-containing protein n=1 Tax=Formosa sediminum TaxID=2594004 RepID=A0A516GSV8_9FLAO|nr:hypothetical protein [Formosa sediminum]QDO94606.1 hypothetical protein FNB79_11730 [Formosa sediminum]